MLNIFKRIIALFWILSIGYANEFSLESIELITKANGIIIKLDLDSIPDENNLTCWQANSGWFYITLYKVICDSSTLKKKHLPDGIIDFQIIHGDESLQLGIRLIEPIENYEIKSIKKKNTIIASLHYSTQYFAQLESSTRKNNITVRKKSPKGVKTWLMMTGVGITTAGLLDSRLPKNNYKTKAGILILLSSFFIDRLWEII